MDPILSNLLNHQETLVTTTADAVTVVVKAAKVNSYSDGSLNAHSDSVQNKLNTTPLPKTNATDQDLAIDYKLVYRQLIRIRKCGVRKTSPDPHSVFMFKVPGKGWCVVPMREFVPLRMYARAMKCRHQHMNFALSEDCRSLLVLPPQKTGTVVTDHCVK